VLSASVTILAAIAGGLLVALLNVRHQRTEGIRDRMLTAADEFSTGMGQALMAARDVSAKAEDALNVDGSLKRASDAVEEARRCVDEAEARTGRVALLFGVESPTNGMAVLAVARLRGYLSDYDDWPPGDVATGGLKDADEAHILFNDRARRAIERYGSLMPRLRRRKSTSSQADLIRALRG
jgi:hypothetical protein